MTIVNNICKHKRYVLIDGENNNLLCKQPPQTQQKRNQYQPRWKMIQHQHTPAYDGQTYWENQIETI